jgi:hypothetical protein
MLRYAILLKKLKYCFAINNYEYLNINNSENPAVHELVDCIVAQSEWGSRRLGWKGKEEWRGGGRRGMEG